ncbi:MAG: amidohydrolase family protein [Terricaulis sp.]
MSKGPAYNRFLADKPGGPVQRLPYRISPAPLREYHNKPRFKAPPGACDTHLHVLGPQKRFQARTDGIKGPFSDVIFEDSTVEDVEKLLDATGLTRGIYVGSMLYGTRYDVMVHALTRMPDRLRGVAIIDPQMTNGELELLDKAGVVGIRISHAYSPDIDDRTVGRAADLSWAINYVTQDWPKWREQVLATPGRFIIEHMGELDPSAGLDSPTFRFLLECLDTGRCWVKLSARMSHQDDFPFSDLLPAIHKLIEHAPTRILWGSDWPHPVYFGRPMVDDVKLLDMMLDWAPDEKTRNRILVDNPAEAFNWKL